MYAEHIAAGMSESIQALCPPSSLQSRNLTPPFILASSKIYHRSYTFVPSVDHAICHLIAYFHLLLDSPFHAPRKFTSYLLATGLPLIIIPHIEAYRYRGKQYWLLRYPTFWLMMAQSVTLGITYAMYWPVLIISRAGSSEAEESNRRTNSETKNSEKIAKLIGPLQAEGLVFGLAIGFALPSVAMVLQNDPLVTWIWQFYPVYVALAQVVYISLRTTDRPHRQNVIRAFYIASFLIASISHILFVLPLFQQIDWKMQLSELLIPLRPSTGAHPSRHAHSFLKWDYALGFGSISVGLLWSARNFGQVLAMLLWYAIAIPAFGAGGAVMGILAWRDL